MTALLTLAHGSRHRRAAAGVDKLTAAAGDLAGVPARAAHLELDTPDLTEVAVAMAAAGHREAVVAPLLFTRAFHATHDVPQAVAAAAAVSGLRLRIAEGLGTDEEIVQVLADRVRQHAPAGAHLVSYSVGSSHPSAAVATQALAERVGELSGHSIQTMTATNSTGPTLGEIAAQHERVHLLPVFVTEGLLLDRLLRSVAGCQDQTGCLITHSAPLKTALAPIIAARYRAALHNASALVG